MELTQFGWVIFPLCAALCLAPFRLLQLTFVAAVFGAAASAVVAGLGLPPGLPPAVLFMGYVLLQYALGERYPGEREVWRLLEPFMLTVAYAILTAVVMPRLFAGQFEVWPQKVDAQFAFPIALGPTRSNYTQSLYLLSNAAMALFGGLFMTRSRMDFSKLLGAYFAGAAVVVAICAWQVVSRRTGLWFPGRSCIPTRAG
jgi:hypothetical protein